MPYHKNKGITVYHSLVDALNVVSDIVGYEVEFSGQTFLLLNDEAFLREIKYRMVDIFEQENGTRPKFKEEAVHECIYQFNFFYYSSHAGKQFVSYLDDGCWGEPMSDKIRDELDKLINFKALYERLDKILSKVEANIDNYRLLWETVKKQFCNE